jgi:hypothetical protein
VIFDYRFSDQLQNPSGVLFTKLASFARKTAPQYVKRGLDAFTGFDKRLIRNSPECPVSSGITLSRDTPHLLDSESVEFLKFGHYKLHSAGIHEICIEPEICTAVCPVSDYRYPARRSCLSYDVCYLDLIGGGPED